ncbi:NAD(P)-binding domain-containing protein [Tahibacter soli]|uniref:NAD(P)-binding domain-containing protein n=1 Tax=Tahibacter soli TaxID=2983605 RepID=A0A9X3YM83_9GAMM|nr:NAD(P)-binding domain-containing protein [Tahibacter soli]MDC8014991.1 NAD(P)-binding domain-containing protein [Tahibacter soli]
MSTALPVVIIGAGPVGLAAAAHVRARGFTPLVLEAGDAVGAGMRQWAHVRMFSPWAFNIDRKSAALLAANGWEAPDPTHFPTGGEVVAHYLAPLAATPALAPHIRVNARVLGVTRRARDRMKNAQRDTTPFVVRYLDHGDEREVLASAVIDASGTIDSPNPIGAAGLPAIGERAARERIAYGMPDVTGAARERYRGKRVLVVGSGHSAFNVLTDLARLVRTEPGTEVHWAVRRPSLRRVLGGGENDQLKERGRLGLRIARLVDDGIVAVHTNVHIDRIATTAEGLVARDGETALPPVDEIVAATGFRPDLSILDEVRLDLDPGTQAPAALAPLIDPNLHSCGTVRPHGAVELRQPDADLYVVGMKSYGRAPTFLLMTGYEQVRSVAAAIAGDWEAARRVELVLPETGVCNTQFVDDESTSAGSCATGCGTATVAATATSSASCGTSTAGCGTASALAPAIVEASAGCCGGPAAADADACCADDANAKAAGKSGCGCEASAVAVPEPAPAVAAAASCCRR